MKKASVIKALKELPNEFHFDDLIEKLIIIEKIDKGLKEAEEGKTVSHNKVKKMVSKWHK